MAIRIATIAAIAACDAIVDLVDSGGAGKIEIRTGTAPTRCEDADSGTLLAELTFSATAFGAASDGTDKASATANSISSDTSANNDGTAAHFRVKNGSGNVVWQGTVGQGSGDLSLDSTSISTGDTVACDSWVFSVSEL